MGRNEKNVRLETAEYFSRSPTPSSHSSSPGTRRRARTPAAMSWWYKKVVFPVRRAWIAVSSRGKPPKHGGGGILKLYDDVRMCGYQDVEVMWEMLTSTAPKQ
ncbi:hypothetical protein Cni_G27101 [Canna indica]|uniref:Uncharacterized protein n=1 Tax=Canna indica TaxID=4628 RepID=A0AAQ3L399_9LILI|nr:hypothetical protein Cni_G27101 [Canna indica]